MPPRIEPDGGRGSAMDRARDNASPTWAEQVVAQALQLITTVLEIARTVWFAVVEITWRDRFYTRADIRVCPICGPYHGRIYDIGRGPSPPLHYGCRCTRRREVPVYKTRWESMTVYDRVVSSYWI
jgi:hypothetical protein